MPPILSISNPSRKKNWEILRALINVMSKQRTAFILIALPPSLIPTLSFIGGITLAHTKLGPYASFYLIGLCTILLCGWHMYATNASKKTSWHLFLISAHLLFGVATMHKHQNHMHAIRDIAKNTDWSHKTYAITDIEQYYTPYHTYRYTLCGKINIPQTDHLISAPVKLITQQPLLYGVGDVIKINNPVFSIAKESLWQERSGTFGSLRINKKSAVEYVGRSHNLVSLYAYNKRAQLYESLKNKLKKNYFNILSVLFFGKKNQPNTHNERIVKQKHQLWGISHYLARSGLHCTLSVIVWESILTIIPFPFYIRQIILLMFLCIYGLLSWLSVSFMRAACMTSLALISKINNRQLYSMHIICCTAYLFLLYNPIYLFCIDFQLSFATTFILSWISQLDQQKKKIL